MPSAVGIAAPNLTTFTRSVRSRGTPIESSTENLISLLKRRQIRGSKDCATATAYLLRRVVDTSKATEVTKLIERVQHVGQRLITAQPKELAIGNIIRRVLGVIREEAEDDRDGETSGYGDAGMDSQPHSPKETRLSDSPSLSSRGIDPSPSRHNGTGQPSTRTDGGAQSPFLLTSHTSYAVTASAPTATSMFRLLSNPISTASSPPATPGSQSPEDHPSSSIETAANRVAAKDLKAEVVEGIQEILDEVSQADDQIAGYALDHIHSNEIILTHSSSITIQRFLLKASGKRNFTVIHAEAYPNDHEATHTTVVGRGKAEPSDDLGPEAFTKSLTAAGITVIVVPDSAVFALMSRVNKVLLSAHAVLADGGLVATAGAKSLAQAAQEHHTNVVVLTAVYQLSPVYPFDPGALMEDGNLSQVVSYNDGDFVDKIEIQNPLFDYVPADLVDLYITNLGGHARSYLYRIVQDHYRTEDIDLDNINALQT